MIKLTRVVVKLAGSLTKNTGVNFLLIRKFYQAACSSTFLIIIIIVFNEDNNP